MAQEERKEETTLAQPWDAPSSSPPDGYVRVAVVQLAYLPAAMRDQTRSVLGDPLFDASHPANDSLLPAGQTNTPDPIADEHKALRQRIREQYVHNLKLRVFSILDACKQYGVELVVFPEYSIPFDLLAPIAAFAPEIVVVAGTHAVEAAALRSNVYDLLQWPRRPAVRESVCPVLHGGKLIGLQPKLSAAKPEQDIMRPGTHWEPVDVGLAAVKGSMGILICLDFLDPNARPYHDHVAGRIDRCNFVAVPSLTPFYSLGDFQARFRNDASLHRRPVLYCNIASEGGTTIHISDDRARRELPFPGYIGAFAKGEEGLLVADIRASHGALGSATTNPDPPLLRPVAAASLVYRSIVNDDLYANWRERLGKALSGVADGDFDALASVAALVQDADALLRNAGRSGMRKHRLTRLRNEIDDAPDVAWIRLLTREVVLPPDVLPWDVLQGALARGAADVAHAWSERDDEGMHEFLGVAVRLRKAVPREDARLSGAGRVAVDAIEKEVRAQAPQARDPRVQQVAIRVYEAIAEAALDEQATQAKRALETGDYDQAEALFREATEKAETIAKAAPENDEAALRAARYRLDLAVCVLNRQALDEGKALLLPIDPALLSARGRCSYAAALASVGMHDRARAAVPSEDASLSDEERTRVQDTKQILAILAGELPSELSSNLHVQRDAAELLLEREDFAAAAEHAIRVIQGAVDDQRLTASAFATLSAALRWSIFEDPPNAAFIPVEAREACVRALDTALERLDLKRLPEGMRRRIEPWRASYWGLAFDVDALSANGPAPSPNADAVDAQARLRAAELAENGKLDKALETLPIEDHPWRTRYLQIELMAIAGETERALTEALLLAREFAGRAPIAYQAAALLHNMGRIEEALPEAEEAFHLFPGKGQRVLLARCLFKEGKAQRAWELLLPLRGARSPRIALLLAEVADSAALHEAPELWERYVADKPEEGTAKVRYAQALFKVDKREEAARVAREVLQAAPRVLSADAIFTAATLVRMKGDEVDEATREHLQRAIELLRERCPGDARAEMYRMQLLMQIGEASDAAVDFELLAQSGFAEAVPLDDLMLRLEQAQQTEQNLLAFYRDGGIPFRTLSMLTSDSPARLLAQWLEAEAEKSALIAAPAMPTSPIDSLEGKAIFVSHLELLLLAHLKLLDLLQERLGPNGRIMLFEETHHHILEDATNLNVQTAAGSLARKLAEDVRAFVARGIREQWVRSIEKPEPSRTLPPLRGNPTEAAQKLAKEPLEHLCAIRTVMEQNQTWLRITADACGSDFLTHLDIAPLFDWQPMHQYLEVSRWNHSIAMRADVHLPDLVRVLMTPQRTDEKLLALAKWGFVDSLRAENLVRIACKPEGFDRPWMHAVLERMESALRAEELSSAYARLQLSKAYGATIWDAFNAQAGETPVSLKQKRPPEHLFDEPGAKTLAGFMLRRAEGVDEKGAPGFLDQVLSFAMLKAADGPAALMRKTDEESLVLDEATRGFVFYRFLYEEWANKNPKRQAALGRAVVDALLLLDELRPQGGPTELEIVGLTPAIAIGVRGGGISLEDPEIEASAILSSQWKEPVLRFLTINVGKPLTLDKVLAHGASILGQSSKDIGGNEKTWFYRIPMEDGTPSLGVFAPVEALLLHPATWVQARKEIAAAWSAHQGIHDGRAHALLRRIAETPEDREIQREYARFTVKAPWRLVRQDPTFLFQFTEPRPVGTAARSLHINTLREMLSEPKERLPAEGSLAEAIATRVKEEGAWQRLSYARQIFLQATAVPGNCVMVTLGTRLAPEGFTGEVQAAMDRLAHPDEHAIAQLAGDLYFLQVAAQEKPQVRLQQGEVDLRQETPSLAAKLLESVFPEEPKSYYTETPPLTLADMEGPLLRLCRKVVATTAQRSGENLPKRDFLWLTYRLYQWLLAQLGRIAPDDRQAAFRRFLEAAPKPSNDVTDILDPVHFDRALFDYRLATVLYTLALSEELSRGQNAPPRVSSGAIEDQLLKLVQVEPRGIALESALDWYGAPEIADLALMALLRADARAILKIPAATRLRFLHALPSTFPVDNTPHAATIFARNFVMAASDIVDKLEPAERTALLAAVRRMDETEHGRLCKASAFTGLFGPNASHLEAEARESLLHHVGAPFAPILVGRFLTSIAALAPARLLAEAESLVASIAEQGEAAHLRLVLIGLARVLLHGPVAARMVGRDALVALAGTEPFVKDPEVNALLGQLGLSREKP